MFPSMATSKTSPRVGDAATGDQQTKTKPLFQCALPCSESNCLTIRIRNLVQTLQVIKEAGRGQDVGGPCRGESHI